MFCTWAARNECSQDQSRASVMNCRKCFIRPPRNMPRKSSASWLCFLSATHVSNVLGSIVTTTTKLPTMSTAATRATMNTLPRLAGNLPRMIQCWLSK